VEPARGRLEADVERALMDVGVMAYAIDRDGVIFWQNHAHRRVVGEAHGSHFNEFVAPEDRRRAQEAFMSKVVGTVPSTQYDVELHSVTGPVQVEVNSVPLVRDGRVVGVLALVASPPLPAEPKPIKLTPRQRDVLRLLANGATTDQIATELHIARETVRNHVRAVLAALGAHSRVEAIAAARTAGVLD
jgi:DNA-binding CsgD family transcriptional regulator